MWSQRNFRVPRSCTFLLALYPAGGAYTINHTLRSIRLRLLWLPFCGSLPGHLGRSPHRHTSPLCFFRARRTGDHPLNLRLIRALRDAPLLVPPLRVGRAHGARVPGRRALMPKAALEAACLRGGSRFRIRPLGLVSSSIGAAGHAGPLVAVAVCTRRCSSLAGRHASRGYI